MTKEEMAKVMDEMFVEERTVREAGQKEYSHGDAFGNFNRLAEQLKLDRKQVLWVYFMKHIDGILAYLNGHKSQREDVRGRIKDARVYLALLRGMIEEEEDTKESYCCKCGAPLGSPYYGAGDGTGKKFQCQACYSEDVNTWERYDNHE